MSAPGFRIHVSGCDAVTRKKLKLYRNNYPDVQLFFDPCPDCDVCVIPAQEFGSFTETVDKNGIAASVVAFGPVDAMAAAFAAGCRDYLCVPWEPEELFERALRCRREETMKVGNARLFCSRNGIMTISAEGVEISSDETLSGTEAVIFRVLVKNTGFYISRGTMADILEQSPSKGSRAVDMHVSRLRKKITKLMSKAGISDLRNPIRTVSGKGWGIE